VVSVAVRRQPAGHTAHHIEARLAAGDQEKYARPNNRTEHLGHDIRR
jgi:hypothetical protein